MTSKRHYDHRRGEYVEPPATITLACGCVRVQWFSDETPAGAAMNEWARQRYCADCARRMRGAA